MRRITYIYEGAFEAYKKAALKSQSQRSRDVASAMLAHMNIYTNAYLSNKKKSEWPLLPLHI